MRDSVAPSSINERSYVKERETLTDPKRNVVSKTESAQFWPVLAPRHVRRRFPSENATSLCPSGQKSDTKNRIERFVTVCGGQRRAYEFNRF